MKTNYILWITVVAVLSLTVARGQGQGAAQPRQQGWAVRQSLNSPSAKLYNNVKQKLLDGRQVACFTISKLDVNLYCEAAKHYDYIWFEMQHSPMSFQDIEKMITACPRPIATPIIRLPDESESNIQKAMDIGALGIDIPTVDDPEKAMRAARYARYPPEGRRSVGGNPAAIWGVNGVNYR
jgi:4-hydroxy-2-oxoheptanedioate aldolase